MHSNILVLGFGAVGRATVELLVSKGVSVTVAQRHRPTDLPVGVEFKPCDVLNQASVQECLKGFTQLVIAIGFEYKLKVWREVWPVAMRHLLNSSIENNLRVVFVDNLYMYGPQTTALHEAMPLTDMGGKPGVRATVTRLWQEAVTQKGLRFTSLRAPDFFGPKVLLSQFGEVVFGNLSRGATAQFLVPIDQPHDFAYVPDMARAVELLLEAPDADFGQVWHMPCAPTTDIRSLLNVGAEALGVAPKVMAIPLGLLRIIGWFFPLANELWEMRFQWDRPYLVNADKFSQRFSFHPTPFSDSVPLTARSFAEK